MSNGKQAFYHFKLINLRENVGGFALKPDFPLQGRVKLEVRGSKGVIRAEIKNLRPCSESPEEKIHYHLWLTAKSSDRVPDVCGGELAVGPRGEATVTWTFDPFNVQGYALEMFSEVAVTAKFGSADPQFHEIVPLKGSLRSSLPQVTKPAPVPSAASIYAQYYSGHDKDWDEKAEGLTGGGGIGKKSLKKAPESEVNAKLNQESFGEFGWRMLDDEELADLPDLEFDEDLYRAEMMDVNDESDEEGEEGELVNIEIIDVDIPEEDELTVPRAFESRELPEEDAFFEIKDLFKDK